MSTATLNAPTPQQAAAAPAGARFDMYQPIHKGLRAFMSDTLGRVGRVDVFDAEDMARTLAQFEALLNFCLKNLAHENEFLHAAIAARVPGGAGRTVDDHVEHIHSIETLRAEGRNLLAAPDAERMALARRWLADSFTYLDVDTMLRFHRDAALELGQPKEALDLYRKHLPALFDPDTEITTALYGPAIDLAALLRGSGDEALADRLLAGAWEVVATLPRGGCCGHGVADVEVLALTDEQLRGLYKNQGQYISALNRRLMELVREGWMLPEYAEDVRADAHAVDIPNPGKGK